MNLESSAAMDMIVENTLLTGTHLVIDDSAPSKTVADCCLVRRYQRKILKDIEVYLIKSVSPNI